MHIRTMLIAIVSILVITAGSFIFLADQLRKPTTPLDQSISTSSDVVDEAISEPIISENYDIEIPATLENSSDDIIQEKKQAVTIPQENTAVKISCSFSASEGSKRDKALLRWSCKDYVGWKCDIKRCFAESCDIEAKNVKLPTSSQEVPASYGTNEPTTIYIGGGRTQTSYSYKEASNFYRLSCSSDSGRIQKFKTEFYQ